MIKTSSTIGLVKTETLARDSDRERRIAEMMGFEERTRVLSALLSQEARLRRRVLILQSPRAAARLMELEREARP